jgi:hypothetical protein
MMLLLKLLHNTLQERTLKGIVDEELRSLNLCREIRQLQSELQSLVDETQSISHKLDARTKQFQLLLFAVRQLSQEVAEETATAAAATPTPMET